MIRSILSVLAGIAVWGLLWVGGNSALAVAMPGSFDANGVTSSSGVLFLILVYSIFLSVLAGWATAVIARRSPTRHALALGLIQLLIGIAAQAAYWELMPLWYHLPFLALLIPGNLLGARLCGQRLSVQPA
jgi:hypothetical protein